mgnify:CR=1 FL=1
MCNFAQQFKIIKQMEFNINKGIVGKKEIIVTKNDTATHYGSGLIDVFATPAMIGLMEDTAQTSVASLLPSGYITLGIEINVKHTKATLVGQKVWCDTELTKVEDKKLFFVVKAYDQQGEIGFGEHIRYIVDGKKFMEKLKTV